MEISRTASPGQSSQIETKVAAPVKVEPTAAADTTKENEVKQKREPRIEQLQSALRELPNVDMEQVSAIKSALARGELSVDVRTLANTLLSYHRGTGA